MTDPSWNRSGTGRRERSKSTSALPYLTSHQTRGIARQNIFRHFLLATSDNPIGIAAISGFVLEGEDSELGSDQLSENHSEFDNDRQFEAPEFHPHQHPVGATGIDDMTRHINIDTYNGELGNAQKKNSTDCVSHSGALFSDESGWGLPRCFS